MTSHPGFLTLWLTYLYSSCVAPWGHLRSSRTSRNLKLIDTLGYLYEKKNVVLEPEGCLWQCSLALWLCRQKLLLIYPFSKPPTHPCPLAGGTRRASAFPGFTCPYVSITVVSLMMMTLLFLFLLPFPIPPSHLLPLPLPPPLLLPKKSLDSITSWPMESLFLISNAESLHHYSPMSPVCRIAGPPQFLLNHSADQIQSRGP